MVGVLAGLGGRVGDMEIWMDGWMDRYIYI